jgi:gluconolactonase
MLRQAGRISFLLVAALANVSQANAFQREESYPVPPEAVIKAGVPQGKIEGPFSFRSEIYPGTERQYWVYVPAQYSPDKPACVTIVQDGLNRARGWRLPQILDNLIHDGSVPVQLGIFVNHGIVPEPTDNAQPRFNRSFEYDSLGDRYARFLIEELLPEVQKSWTVSDEPNDRCLAGASSGGICAFNAAWERPDAFRRVSEHDWYVCRTSWRRPVSRAGQKDGAGPAACLPAGRQQRPGYLCRQLVARQPEHAVCPAVFGLRREARLG